MNKVELSESTTPAGRIQVTAIKGPLEEGWQHKVQAFAATIPTQA